MNRPTAEVSEVAATADVVAALRSVGVDVDASSTARAEYSTDASLYRVVPQAVVFPRHEDDVLAAVEAARAQGVALTARGAGTSVAGNAVGTGLLLDFSRHLHRVLGVDPDARTARVQPGVILDQLQAHARGHGLRFGPDPSTHARCTLGGMIGNNACGSRALGYGRTSDNVAGLRMVTCRGEVLDLRRGGTPDTTTASLVAARAAVRENLAVIRTELGRFGRQVSGYALEHLLPENSFDVARAAVGSEGTWGLLLEATVDLVPLPRYRLMVALGYRDIVAAGAASPAVLPHDPVAVEGLDHRITDAVSEHRAHDLDLPDGGGWLLVELAGDDAAELRARARAVVADADAIDHRLVAGEGRMAAIWRIREDGAGLAARSRGGVHAHAGWEDAAVPVEHLGDYLRDFDDLLAGHRLHGAPYGHFGEGCVHVRIDFPLDAPDGRGAYRAFIEDAAKLVAGYGGSMSGEHGDGRARSEVLSYLYSSAALNAFARVKAAFDPYDLMNPGVLVDPRPFDADLRVPAAEPRRIGLPLAFADDAGDFAKAVHRCTGVGKCRAPDSAARGEVMCPSYMATREEKDSTRGRARILQEMVNGSLVTGGWRAPEVHEALDLCLSCKGCASDCPTGVDMATYKATVLHQAYRGRIRPPAHYSLGWLPSWARVGARAPRLTNALLRAPGLARLGKAAAGVDARRDLPPFATQTFRRWFDHRPTATSGDPVLLWVDTFTDYFTPQVGAATVRVLEQAGYRVELTSPGQCCGLTWISTGQLDTARRRLSRAVDEIDQRSADGRPVVGIEPSCTAVFRGDAEELMASSRLAQARRVAGRIHTLAEVLAGRPGWKSPDLSGTRVVAQPHCHHHAVMSWDADQALLAAAGAEVERIGGCCGLAGNFGAERGHYDVSVAVAETALLPAVRRTATDQVVLADGFSCRTQLDHLTGRRGLHLAELLDGTARDQEARSPDDEAPSTTHTAIPRRRGPHEAL